MAVTAVLAGLSGAAIAGTAATATAGTVVIQDYTTGQHILDHALSRAGDWYSYGAAGPSVFDCSGLVDWAAGADGLGNWPRDTYEIAAGIGTRFSITSRPVRGDLALWGPVSAPYHVEIVTAWGPLVTFGAQTWGTRVGWHDDRWFVPSFYLHVNY